MTKEIKQIQTLFGNRVLLLICLIIFAALFCFIFLVSSLISIIIERKILNTPHYINTTGIYKPVFTVAEKQELGSQTIKFFSPPLLIS